MKLILNGERTLVRDTSTLTVGLLRSGYDPLPGPPADQQLDFCRQEVASSFALLGKDRFGLPASDRYELTAVRACGQEG